MASKIALSVLIWLAFIAFVVFAYFYLDIDNAEKRLIDTEREQEDVTQRNKTIILPQETIDGFSSLSVQDKEAIYKKVEGYYVATLTNPLYEQTNGNTLTLYLKPKIGYTIHKRNASDATIEVIESNFAETEVKNEAETPKGTSTQEQNISTPGNLQTVDPFNKIAIKK